MNVSTKIKQKIDASKIKYNKNNHKNKSSCSNSNEGFENKNVHKINNRSIS